MSATDLSPLLRSALDHVPTDSREAAHKLALMGQIGFGEMEVARENGMTWKQLDRVRRELQAGIVRALYADGLTEDEIRRSLGIDRATVYGALHDETCLRGMSGEPEQLCQCKRIHEGGDKDYTHEGDVW